MSRPLLAPLLLLAVMGCTVKLPDNPTVASTALPQAPSPRATVQPSPTASPYSGDITALVAWGFPLNQDATLPSGPTSDSPPTTWELAPDQADKATLVGNTLHALKPGGILLEGHTGQSIAYLFMAACRPDVSSDAGSSNTYWGDFKLNGARIFTTSADWNTFYQSQFAPASGTRSTTTPTPSTPPIDFSQHSLLLYQSDAGANEDGVYVADATSDTVDLVITSAFGEGWMPQPSTPELRLVRLIPQVSASATVNIERMPPEALP